MQTIHGRAVVRLEDLAGFDGRLEWPIVELADGSLAVLVSDLVGGRPLKANDYGPDLVEGATR